MGIRLPPVWVAKRLINEVSGVAKKHKQKMHAVSGQKVNVILAMWYYGIVEKEEAKTLLSKTYKRTGG